MGRQPHSNLHTYFNHRSASVEARWDRDFARRGKHHEWHTSFGAEHRQVSHDQACFGHIHPQGPKPQKPRPTMNICAL